MNISKWALANNKLVYYFIAILVIGGLYSYENMSKLEDPAIKVKQAVVVTTYPGASSYEVELQVTDKLEKAIYSMNGVDVLDSNSSADLSIITVKLLTTIPDDEIEQYWDLLRRKVADAQRHMPTGASTSVVVDDYGDVYGMFYALTAEGYSNEELNDYAELIKQRIRGVEGVSRVELYGALSSTIEISIYEDRMANMGLSPLEVIQTISGQNKVVYSGYFLSGEQRLRVNVNDKYRDIDDIENLIISGHEDDVIRLRDIAKVERSYAEPRRNAMSYDRKEAIGISISAMAGTDVTKVGREVDGVLEQLREERLPVGIECHKVFFQPERVSVAIESFLINLLESILIVVIVLMFAMGIRSGVLLGVTLLVTVLGSLLFLNMLGGTLQRVSLGSFILAMGMLVDNAIVIVDGILNDMKGGGLRSRTLSDVGRRTAMPLLGATIIAILAFLPLFLSPDTAGVYVRDLFVVLTVSLMLSWVLSLMMVPLQAKAMFKFTKGETRKPKGANETNETSGASVEGESLTLGQRVLRQLLELSLRYRGVAVVAALVLVAASGYIYKVLPQSFFPDLSYNQLYIEYKLPESSNWTHTAEDLDSISEYLLSREDVAHVTTSVGATPSRYNLVRSIATPALSYGDVIVDFTSEAALVAAIPAVQQYLTDNYPQSYVRVKRYNLMYNKYPIEATFRGPDPAVLRDLTEQAQQIMSECDDIMLITSDWERRVPVLEVDYNQSAARELGFSRQDVALSLLVSTDGMPLESLYQGADREQIVVRCVDRDGRRIESLESAPVFSLLPSIPKIDKELVQGVISGAVSKEDLLESVLKTTPLSQAISGINIRWEDPLVVRHRGERAMRAQANNIPSVGAEDARRQIAQQVEAIELPEGYSLSWQGEYETKSKALKYLLANIPLAIALMIGILILLFKDYRKPVIIMLCVPLLFVGALFGVWVAGMSFGFLAICGILGLIGMMIKNGVVLMDEINDEIKRGKEPKQAVIDSSLSRFRAVMMASLTTVLGMIPLLPDTMFGPLAATIMGGLLVGTVVTLIFIPTLYSIFFGIKVK